MPEPATTYLERRKIEAGVMIPPVRACARACGKERAAGIARAVIAGPVRRDGAR